MDQMKEGAMPITIVNDNLAMAVAFERDGHEFYRKARDIATNPMARSFYELLMDEENRHSIYLTELHGSMSAGGDWPEKITISMDNDFKMIFKEATGNIGSRLSLSTTEIDTLRFAIEMEYKGRDMYKELKEKASDQKEAALYGRLSDWELAHALFLEDYYGYFEDEGLFMNE